MEICFESPLAEELKSKLEINEESLKTFEYKGCEVKIRLINTIKHNNEDNVEQISYPMSYIE